MRTQPWYRSFFPIGALLMALLLPAAARSQDTEKIPDPEDITLETKDHVVLKCTWYPGTLKKQAVPFIMLHGWEGQRGEYDTLALWLQGQGHAVLCPDLRGHGQSLTRKTGPMETEDLEIVEQPKRIDLESMVLDVEACKKFLREKNNLGELNIEQLCLVAADFSCIVAMRWAAADWSVQNLAAFKQGHDVKAIVMLSPLRTFKGLTLQEALTHPDVRSKLSVMIVAGKQDTKSLAEAKRIHTSLERYHPKEFKDDSEKDLVLIEPVTSLEGTKLLTPNLKIYVPIGNFVKFRLTDKSADYAWLERKNPLGGN